MSRSINGLAIEKCAVMRLLASYLERDYDYWLKRLLQIETLKTATDELDKIIRALSTYATEIPLLANRCPMGSFRVMLPYNNPLYSLVLYSCGISLAGNKVLVRPSRLTFEYVYDFVRMYASVFDALDILLYYGSGKDFIDSAINQVETGGILFAGQYDNVTQIIESLPSNQRLIYCGPGVSPFVVGCDVNNIPSAVELAVASRCYNSGQDCLCSEKFVIHDSVYSFFCDSLISKLKQLKVGAFRDISADIFPPMPGMGQYAQTVLESVKKQGNELFINYNDVDAILAFYEVDIKSEALHKEKYCPIFTVARYCDDSELLPLIESPYRFSAMLVAGASTQAWHMFPHISTGSTVIDEKSIDAHKPFGGCGKSGFSRINNHDIDGPILYSIESSCVISDDHY